MFMVFVVIGNRHRVDVTTASYSGLLVYSYVMCLCVCGVRVSTNWCMMACEILIPWFLTSFDAPSEAPWDTHMKRLLVATETKQPQVCILSKQLTQTQKRVLSW